jgi:hypothetical protein
MLKMKNIKMNNSDIIGLLKATRCSQDFAHNKAVVEKYFDDVRTGRTFGGGIPTSSSSGEEIMVELDNSNTICFSPHTDHAQFRRAGAVGLKNVLTVRQATLVVPSHLDEGVICMRIGDEITPIIPADTGWLSTGQMSYRYWGNSPEVNVIYGQSMWPIHKMTPAEADSKFEDVEVVRLD